MAAKQKRHRAAAVKETKRIFEPGRRSALYTRLAIVRLGSVAYSMVETVTPGTGPCSISAASGACNDCLPSVQLFMHLGANAGSPR